MMKWAGRLVGWLAILLVGLFLISNLTFHTGLAGSGVGTGVFSHWFRAQFELSHDFDAGDSTSGSISVEAKHPARFMLSGHESPNYRNAKIKWFLFREEANRGEATINLENMQIVWDGDATSLNPENIVRLFGITAPTDQDTLMANALLEFLHSARDGKLPLPNHHGHSLPEPLSGRMQHFATGFSLLPVELAWLIGWAGFGIVGLFRARGHRPNTTAQTTASPSSGL